MKRNDFVVFEERGTSMLRAVRVDQILGFEERPVGCCVFLDSETFVGVSRIDKVMKRSHIALPVVNSFESLAEYLSCGVVGKSDDTWSYDFLQFTNAKRGCKCAYRTDQIVGVVQVPNDYSFIELAYEMTEATTSDNILVCRPYLICVKESISDIMKFFKSKLLK